MTEPTYEYVNRGRTRYSVHYDASGAPQAVFSGQNPGAPTNRHRGRMHWHSTDGKPIPKSLRSIVDAASAQRAGLVPVKAVRPMGEKKQGKLRATRYTPSIDRRSGPERRMTILKMAAGIPQNDYQHFWRGRHSFVGINCLGGYGLKNPDIQWLLKRGLIEIVRGTGTEALSGPYMIRRTFARATDEGRKVIEADKF